MNSKLRFLLFLLTAVSIISCKNPKAGNSSGDDRSEGKTELSGSIIISGAYALSELVSLWADEFTGRNPGVSITVRPGSTGEGISDLLTGKATLAMISRPLAKSETESGIWVVPVARDGVAPVVNQQNPLIARLLRRGLSPDEFRLLFSGEPGITWGKLLDTSVNLKPEVYIRDYQAGATEIFARFLSLNANDLTGTIRDSDEEIIASVAASKLAIGFCNFSYAFDPASGQKTAGIQVLPVDIDDDNSINRKEFPFENLNVAHRSIWMGIYPDALCRELTIGSLGKPQDELTRQFLIFVLSEGQKMVTSMGLCELNSIYIGFALESLK